jgi:hypothetical protein
MVIKKYRQTGAKSIELYYNHKAKIYKPDAVEVLAPLLKKTR